MTLGIEIPFKILRTVNISAPKAQINVGVSGCQNHDQNYVVNVVKLYTMFFYRRLKA